jgi:hypothetical protein
MPSRPLHLPLYNKVSKGKVVPEAQIPQFTKVEVLPKQG